MWGGGEKLALPTLFSETLPHSQWWVSASQALPHLPGQAHWASGMHPGRSREAKALRPEFELTEAETNLETWSCHAAGALLCLYEGFRDSRLVAGQGIRNNTLYKMGKMSTVGAEQ